MKRFKIGIMADGLRLPLREGIIKSRELGAEGIQLYATHGEMMPDNLSKEDRRELLKFIRAQGLVVSALCGDPGGHGFGVEEKNPARIALSKAIIDLALDLECNVVTTHIGVVPEKHDDPERLVMQKACRELGLYAGSKGASFAIETGPEPAERLRGFLDSLECDKGMGVNFDPANLVMVIGEDTVDSVNHLAPYIVHTHAKDGKQFKKPDPLVVYGISSHGGADMNDFFLETPLGEGGVDFPKYLDALEKAGFEGFLTIEREVGDRPEEDIGAAVRFLRNII